MIPIACSHEKRNKHGKNRNGSQRWKCRECNQTFSDEHVATGPLGDMQANEAKVFMALEMLCEGMGMNAVCRITVSYTHLTLPTIYSV